MSDTDNGIDERLVRALDNAVPQPPREIDPESVRTASPGRRSRSLGPALAAAAIVVVAVGVGLVTHRHDAPSSAPGHGPNQHAGPTGQSSTTGQAPPVNHGPANPAGVTAHVVARLLAAAPTPPGGTPVDHAPVKTVRSPMESPASPNLVRRTRWWTAPGTMGDAIAYFTAHPPAGTKSSGSSTASGPGGTTAVGASFDASGRRWARPTVYTELELEVAVAPAPGGVAVRVDAEAIWLPPRTPAEQIPDDVTSVDVVVDRNGHARTVRRTLGARDARSLAAVLNGLPVVTPGEFSCPVDFGWRDRLTFHGARGDVQVDAAAGGCGPVTVGPRSEHNPTLSGGWAVDRAVLRALGLPRHYGQ